ncbi:hypothetical protein TruAng_006224 [Truncatella angustata]|nr:hypothetical protein TruAng_006224 [Truncatella angustata]
MLNRRGYFRSRYLRELERRSNFGDHGIVTPGSEQAHVSGVQGGRARARAAASTPGPVRPLASRLTTPHDYANHESVADRPTDDAAQTSSSSGSPFRQNPLVDYDLTFAKAAGRYWYMGPSSSWSFCRRIFALIQQRIPEANCPPDPWNLDGSAFDMHWVPIARNERPDVTNIPPLDYALFLFNTAKFYLGGHFMCLIDESSYMKNLHEFYKDPASKASDCRHWFAQYLLILAFGKAFSSTCKCPSGPPGHQYALRAMRLLPGMAGLPPDTTLAVQVLALAAVYLQSVDMRVGALQYIGQALRTCIVEGWHRHMPADAVGDQHSRLCNNTFWVVYILERELSALFGSPNSIRDEDITAKLPSELDNSANASEMDLHIRLSGLRAEIMNTVYGAGAELQGSLVVNTHAILRGLAKLLGDMNTLLLTRQPVSVNKASRTALRLILGHHHCVVLSTRPTVMCALYIRLDRRQTQTSHAVSLSPAVTSLIQTCVDSAQATLRTLRVLSDEDLLEGFLPFQIEDAFSSAFILHLIRFIDSTLISDDAWSENANIAFDRMISKGSMVAPLRLQELRQLERTLSSLSTDLDSTSPMEKTVGHGLLPVSSVLPHETTIDDAGWNFFVRDCLGVLSPREMMDLADQLEMDGAGPMLFEPTL